MALFYSSILKAYMVSAEFCTSIFFLKNLHFDYKFINFLDQKNKTNFLIIFKIKKNTKKCRDISTG